VKCQRIISVSWTSRVKPKLTVYDKLLCKNKKSISSVWWAVGVKWETVCSFHSLPFPSNRFHFHSRGTILAIPIPMRIPWDPWEFPI